MLQKRVQDPPFGLATFVYWGRGIGLAIAVAIILAAINIGQTSTLIVLPFSRRAFRRLNRWIADSWWGVAIGISLRMIPTRLVISGDEIPPDENIFLIANHQEMADVFAIMIYAKSKGRLGDLKWFVKDILKYVPGIGWGMHFLDCLFVRRHWDADAKRISSIFSKYLVEKIPLWLISFVEGTRITEEKAIRSQYFASERNLPFLQNVLLPRTKGFYASVHALNSHIDAVYDVTIVYPNGIPSLWQIMKGLVPEIDFNIKRYTVESLANHDLNKWLVDRFMEKDAYIEKKLNSIRSNY